jgi:hypothetical protein
MCIGVTAPLPYCYPYLNVTRRYLKKNAGYKRPFTERPISSHYGVPCVQSCHMPLKTCLERSNVLIT